jgi:hypothetical protein
MILSRPSGSDEAYFFTYVEDTDNDANKNSTLIYKWNKPDKKIEVLNESN